MECDIIDDCRHPCQYRLMTEQIGRHKSLCAVGQIFSLLLVICELYKNDWRIQGAHGTIDIRHQTKFCARLVICFVNNPCHCHIIEGLQEERFSASQLVPHLLLFCQQLTSSANN